MSNAAPCLTRCALEKGLIVLTCGTQGQAIRIRAPLAANDAILDEGLSIPPEALVREENL